MRIWLTLFLCLSTTLVSAGQSADHQQAKQIFCVFDPVGARGRFIPPCLITRPRR